MKRTTLLSMVIGFYALITIAFCWQLLMHLTTAVPDGPLTDYDHFIWNYWWMSHALSQGMSPLYSDFMLYPNMHNLSVHTLTPIWLPLWYLVEPLLGRVAFFNIALMLSFILTATATFFWVYPFIENRLLAFTTALSAGAIFAFQPYLQLAASSSHLNIVSIWWVPLTCLLWREIVYTRFLSRPTASLLLGLAFWGCWLTDFSLWLFLPFTLGIYGLWTLWHNRIAWRSLLLWGGVAVGIMLAGMMIFPLPSLLEVDTSDPNVYPPASLLSTRDWSLEPSSWLGLDIDNGNRRLGTGVAAIFWLTLIVTGVMRWRNRKTDAKESVLTMYPAPPAWLWLLMALPLALLMLGDRWMWLPYRYLHELLNGQYRTPERFVLPLTFVLVTFLALQTAPLFTRLYKRSRFAVALPLIFCALVLVEAGTFRPFPILQMPEYPIYETIGAEEGDYVIFDVPVGVHYGWTGMGEGRYSIYYSPVHQKRTVNGFLARMPFSDYAYYTDSPLFRWLALDYPLDATTAAQITDEFETYRVDYPIGYVFANRRWMQPDQMTHWIGWINERDGFCAPEISADAMLLWWRNVDLGCDNTEPTTRIDLGSDRDWLSIGTGWYNQENVGGPSARWASEEATLRLNPPPAESFRFTFTATAFHQDRELRIGDETLLISANGWNTYTVTMRADMLENGLLTLTHASTNSAAELSLSPDERQISVAYDEFFIQPVD